MDGFESSHILQGIHANTCHETVVAAVTDDCVLARGLSGCQRSDRIVVIFDVCRDQSIKSAERVTRGSQEGVTFKTKRPGHKIKKLRRLLACSEKNKITTFLAESWKEESKREKLGSRTMFVMCEEKCFKLIQETCAEMQALRSSHEEADTRLLLHAHHTAVNDQSLVVVADDTGVLIICLSLSSAITSNIFIRRETKYRIWMIDIRWWLLHWEVKCAQH